MGAPSCTYADGVGLDAAGFDRWYTDMADADTSRRDDLVRAMLGLPPELQSSSLLPWHGLAEVVDALALPSDAVLVDLACGRGGYGMEVARRTGARLVGVDFSTVAVEQARAQAPVFGVADRATFVVGDLTDTGLPGGCADAAMCVDAVQFAGSVEDALTELRRILRPGGRAVLTCWEPVDAMDERLPDRIRRMDLAGGLHATGFTGVEVTERPVWHATERTLWEAAVRTDPGGDPALRSLHDEATRVLSTFDARRRVLAVATAP